MTTALATAVALGFIWSIMLFCAAVFIREREQETGFGWALGGAAIFFVVFADKLPGEPIGLREIVTLLPGVGDGQQLFTSSMFALLLLLIVYLFRIAVFYRLFMEVPSASADDESEDILNDYVAPTLSYLCFAICLVSLLQPIYDLSVFMTVLVSAILVVGHYWGILPRLIRYIRDFWAIVIVLASRFRRAFSRAVVLAVVGIARAEELRRADSPGGVSTWAQDRLKTIDDEKTAAFATEQEILKRAARRLTGRDSDNEEG